MGSTFKGHQSNVFYVGKIKKSVIIDFKGDFGPLNFAWATFIKFLHMNAILLL